MLRDVSHGRALAEFCFNQLRLLSGNMTPPTLPSRARRLEAVGETVEGSDRHMFSFY
jgi:hypothetical protein